MVQTTKTDAPSANLASDAEKHSGSGRQAGHAGTNCVSTPKSWHRANGIVSLSPQVVAVLQRLTDRPPSGTNGQQNGRLTLPITLWSDLSNAETEWMASKGYLHVLGRNGDANVEVYANDRGISFASHLAAFVNGHSIADLLHSDTGDWIPMESPSPYWDAKTYDLWLSPTLIKHFRRRAINQMAILDAFQEQDWPARIQDPLPLTDDESIVLKRRLNDTLRNMNRSLGSQLIKFCGDGAGTGILWRTSGFGDSAA